MQRNSGTVVQKQMFVSSRDEMVATNTPNSPAQTQTGVNAGAPAGFQARVGKIRRKAPKKFFSFAHPGFQFAHPAIRNGLTVAHRTEADLREKASLATNQEGPLPSPPLLSV